MAFGQTAFAQMAGHRITVEIILEEFLFLVKSLEESGKISGDILKGNFEGTPAVTFKLVRHNNSRVIVIIRLR